jgi:quinohemoprotein ethanol dehydrogenase
LGREPTRAESSQKVKSIKIQIALVAAAAIVTAIFIARRAPSQPFAFKGLELGNVTEARVLAEEQSGADWPIYGRDFGARHFSPLKQITGKNIQELGLAWYLDIDSPMGLSSEPIEVDGVIYVTTSLAVIYAVDAVTGKLLWKFDPHEQRGVSTQNSYAVRVNRGVAVWQGKVYVATGDCRLMAIDANSGKEVWASQICDPHQTGSTDAPHIAGGNVLIGYNGSDDMIRGSLVALNAQSGKEAWRFWTVPGNPTKGFESKALEMAAKTWVGKKEFPQWWRFGGGDVWAAVTWDRADNLVIFGTAGAGSVEGTTPRSAAPDGAKLFSGCVVAVHADTGKYVWHFQTSGAHFQTENFHIIVTDLVLNGQRRHVAITAPRNGFIYVLDARTGQPLEAKPYGTVRWATSIDLRTGRPVEAPSQGSREGRGGAGKTWWPMSYDPVTGLVYIPAYDTRPRPEPGQSPMEGKLAAWDPISQSVRWFVAEPIQTNSGVLSTAGNLVFQGQGTGEFDAYAANTGQKVWSIQTGSAIDSVPVTFSVKDQQYILVPVGWGSASRLFLPASAMATPKSERGPSRPLAFKLGADLRFPTPPDTIVPVPKPPKQTASEAVIQEGRTLYETHMCGGCHSPGLDGSGAWTVNGAVPDLRYAPPEVHRQWDAIVFAGTHKAEGMMAFGVDQHFPDLKAFNVEESHAIHAYVIQQSWKAYEGQHKLNSLAK